NAGPPGRPRPKRRRNRPCGRERPKRPRWARSPPPRNSRRGAKGPARGRETIVRSLIILTFAGMRLLSAQTALPTEWIDSDTGHRVIRLSREDGTASLYFHQNAYSADGKKLVVTNPRGIATINLATREIDQVVEGRVNI